MMAADRCGGTVTLFQSPAAGTIISAVGTITVTLTATDSDGNSTACYATYTTKYQSSGSCMVNGSPTPGHQILQPVNLDGTSVFKQGSTVPAKFMVFDAICNSVGTPGMVTTFKLIQTISGTPTA